MNNDQTKSTAADLSGAALTETESKLGQALALIHRVLPRLDEPNRSAEVQAVLQRAAACVESARQAHVRSSNSARLAAASPVQTRVEAETVAIISAAVAAILDRPYRLVSVQLVAAPVPHLNVWALEGRTQIFQSHKIR
jgi:hypothetical protein